jgi:hypothetical protein
MGTPGEGGESSSTFWLTTIKFFLPITQLAPCQHVASESFFREWPQVPILADVE